ncbi:unnamed protein product, partial [Meganyctiphanes norvegica]
QIMAHWRPHTRGRHHEWMMMGAPVLVNGYQTQQLQPSRAAVSLAAYTLLIILTSGCCCTSVHATPGTSTISVSDPVWEIRHVLPEVDFENNTVTDVSVNVGDLAYLPCRFPQMSTIHNQVSWIRRYDWHILTTGVFTYTSDLRFNVLHAEGSDDWTLQLKFVDVKDNGTYECQVYTGTGVLSQFVNLHVNTPKASILGPKDIHVHEGDTITLFCVIKQSKPPFVFWYHGAKMVNYEGQRLDVYLEQDATKTHSTLTITDARFTDSGNYSCIPPHVEPACVNVFVTEAGDTAAAVQRRDPAATSSGSVELHRLPLILLATTVVIIMLYTR